MKTDGSFFRRIVMAISPFRATVVLFGGLGLSLVLALFIIYIDLPKKQKAAHNDNGVAAAQEILSTLSVVGTIEAYEVVSVSAPFDGIIKNKFLAFDTQVEQGQLLLILDTAELRDRIQDAKISMLKAANNMQELEHWELSSEVARSKRNFLQTQQQVEQAERKAREAEMLLQKGIIPRTEYEGLLEQLNDIKNQMAAVSDDLRAANAKGNQASLQIARIEYDKAKTKLTELSNSLSHAKILSPNTGIVSKILSNSGQTPASLDVGSRVAKGQLLFNVALTDKLRVAAKVDEVDIADLVLGMPVMVSIESQGIPALQGRLAEISAQANIGATGSRSAVFDIKIEIPDIDTQQQSRLRVGMSCNVSIETGKQAPLAPTELTPSKILQSNDS